MELYTEIMPIWLDCKESVPQWVSLGTRLIGIFTNYEQFIGNLMKNSLSIVGDVIADIMNAKFALEKKDYVKFGDIMGSLFYKVILMNC